MVTFPIEIVCSKCGEKLKFSLISKPPTISVDICRMCSEIPTESEDDPILFSKICEIVEVNEEDVKVSYIDNNSVTHTYISKRLLTFIPKKGQKIRYIVRSRPNSTRYLTFELMATEKQKKELIARLKKIGI